MNQRHGQLAALAAALLFGCSAPLISLFTADGSALSIAGLLYAGASLGLLLLRLAQPRKAQETPLQRADWPGLALLTLLGGVVAPVALVFGLAHLPAASSSLLLNLEAVFTLLIAVVVGGEHLGRRALLAALLTIAGAVVLSQGSLSGANWQGAGLIALATLAWGIDNNISQRLSLRDPMQIASIKAIGAGLPMLAGAVLLGHPFPAAPVIAALLVIGALGYGLSIWLDLLALRALGAAREAVIFASAPFVGALFAVLVLGEAPTAALAAAAALMVLGVALLLGEQHSHWHHHEPLRHAHRHRHDPRHDPRHGDPHHDHGHSEEESAEIRRDRPYWHAHEHDHDATAHAHPHGSDAHHRHHH